jgi:hypothetical protein
MFLNLHSTKRIHHLNRNLLSSKKLFYILDFNQLELLQGIKQYKLDNPPTLILPIAHFNYNLAIRININIFRLCLFLILLNIIISLASYLK